MKAILIDPVARSVTEVEYEGGLDSLYRLLDCQRVDALHLNGNIFEDGWNSVFIDDEALLDEENAPRHYFEIETERGWSPPVGSKGLVVGGNHEGKDIATALTVEEIKTRVKFTERRFRGFRELPMQTIDHPVFGKILQVGVTADIPLVDGVNEEDDEEPKP